jgi:D-aminoacyl-tRNA deacylase
MILLIQRVLSASVSVHGEIVGEVGRGLLAFIAIEPGDDEATARRLVERLLAYRVFNDDDGRMNRSLADVAGELLLVSQFTLAADTRKGLRPSFTSAAPPELGRRLFEQVVSLAQQALPGRVATGRFGAEMQVALVNDGPVTFWLRFSSAGANESS